LPRRSFKPTPRKPDVQILLVKREKRGVELENSTGESDAEPAQADASWPSWSRRSEGEMALKAERDLLDWPIVRDVKVEDHSE